MNFFLLKMKNIKLRGTLFYYGAHNERKHLIFPATATKIMFMPPPS